MKKTIFVFSALIITASVFGFIAPVLAAEIPCGDKTIQEVEWLKTVGITNGLLIPVACLCGGQIETVVNPDGSTAKTTITCGLPQIIQTIFNFVTLLLALTGSAALLMFTYGGIMFIIAFGSSERVQKAKQVLTAAVIGIIIIFSAWVVINFVILALTGCEIGNKTGVLFSNACKEGGAWNKATTGTSSGVSGGAH